MKEALQKRLFLSLVLVAGCGDSSVPIGDPDGGPSTDVSAVDVVDVAQAQDLAPPIDLPVDSFVAPDNTLPDLVPTDPGTDPGPGVEDDGGSDLVENEEVTTMPCPLGPCIESAVADETGCTLTFKLEDSLCDDEDVTTRDDLCDGLGTCSGTAYTCDPAMACIPEYVQDGEGCLAQMADAGTQCNDNNSETVEDKCDGQGNCAGVAPCFDLDPEPNNSASAAVSLGTIGDCDGDGSNVTGVLNGQGDVDWYSFVGEDGFTCTSQAVLTLIDSAGVEACLYTSCINEPENTDVECAEGTLSTAPNGLSGCCGTGSVEVDTDCSGFSDDVTAYIRIRKQGSGSATCIPYSFEYHN